MNNSRRPGRPALPRCTARISPAGLTTANRIERALADLDPTTVEMHPDLIQVALLYTQLDIAPERRRQWACYADQAATVLDGPNSPLALQAAGRHADMLTLAGRADIAVNVRQRISTACDQRDDAYAIITARLALGRTLHAAGRCDDAEKIITALLTAVPGPSVVVGAATLQAGCGHIRRAAHLLWLHSGLFTRDDHFAAAEAASLIVATEIEHPAVCSRHPTGLPPDGTRNPQQRTARWQTLLVKPDLASPLPAEPGSQPARPQSTGDPR